MDSVPNLFLVFGHQPSHEFEYLIAVKERRSLLMQLVGRDRARENALQRGYA